MVDPNKWPSSVESPWLEGEAKIKQLCERFGLEGPAIKRAFRDYVDEPSSRPHDISHTYPVSTADCERGFSTMNVIATKTGSKPAACQNNQQSVVFEFDEPTSGEVAENTDGNRYLHVWSVL